MLAAGAETIGAGEGALLVGMQKAFSGLWGDGGGVIGAEAMDGGGTTNTTGSLGAMTGSTSSTLGGHATGSSWRGWNGAGTLTAGAGGETSAEKAGD